MEGQQVADTLLADYRRQLGDSHPLVGRAWRVVANLQCSGGKLDACASSIGQAERIVRLHYGEQHPEFADVLRVRSLLGVFGQSSPADAITMLRRAEVLLIAAYPPQHETVLRVRAMLARRLLFFDETGMEEAIALMEQVMADHARGQLSPQPVHRVTLVEGLTKRARRGDLQRARQLLEQNEVALRAYPPAYSMVFYNRYLMARADYQEGEVAQADARLAGVAAALRQHLATTNNRILRRDVLMLRARIALDRGDAGNARDLLEQAVAHMESTLGPDHNGTHRTRDALKRLRETGTFALLN